MKTKNILITTVATLLFVPAFSSPAKASTWHRYTPIILRGHWYSLRKYNVMGTRLRYFCVLKKNYFNAGGLSDPVLNNRIQYQHQANSHSYLIKCHETFYSHGAQTNYYKFILQKSNVTNKAYRLKFKFLGSRTLNYHHNKFYRGTGSYGKWLYR
ncbi:MAG: hypothetical protein LKF37_05970 [Lentilactobacillus diolivorans]|jgi:hypothetical protein|nr:hypothetical protein [Lentilactobacillus diolivorans]RRG01327.1 MAG: hypothetical protein DUD34_12565 [Lactobacillus sp.]